MRTPNGPIIDMTGGGEFIDPPKPGLGTIAARVAAFGLLLFMAAAAFWAALFLIPLLLVLGAVGYFTFRHQLRRGGFRSNFIIIRRP